MKKAEQLYEGKAKKVFKTDDSELLIVEYKDDATAFNGFKKGTIKGKGNFPLRRFHRIYRQKSASKAICDGFHKKQRSKRKNKKSRRPNPAPADFSLAKFFCFAHKNTSFLSDMLRRKEKFRRKK